VLCDPERAKRWGENGRKRVLQYFTWRKAAEQTLEIYETIVLETETSLAAEGKVSLKD